MSVNLLNLRNLLGITYHWLYNDTSPFIPISVKTSVRRSPTNMRYATAFVLFLAYAIALPIPPIDKLSHDITKLGDDFNHVGTDFKEIGEDIASIARSQEEQRKQVPG